MKYKNSKKIHLNSSVAMWICECAFVSGVCVRMRVPTVCFRQVFALVDSAAATFITAWENVMR